MREAGQIDLLHHLFQALVRLADQERLGAFEADFPAGHRFGAEFVFQANDSVGVATAVAQPPGQRKQRQPTRARGSTFGARQHQRDIGIGMRTKPFFAVQAPGSVLQPGDRFNRADIRTAGLFGDELRALPHRGKVG